MTPLLYFMAGHSWWMLHTDAPLDAFAALSRKMKFDFTITSYLDGANGYFPKPAYYAASAVLQVPGELRWPFGGATEDNADHTFEIGFGDLIGGLTFTKGVDDNPGTYKLTTATFIPLIPVKNCTTQTVKAATAAGVALPPNDCAPQDLGIDLKKIPYP